MVATAEARARKAYDLERKGHLAAALNEWKVVALVDPEEASAAEHIRRIQGEIAKRAQQHMQRGEKALAEGEHTSAYAEFLKVLAVAPHDTDAFKRLQALETRNSRRWQSAWGLDAVNMPAPSKGAGHQSDGAYDHPPSARDQRVGSSPMVRGMNLYQSSRYAESIVEFDREIRSGRSSEKARLYRAKAYLHLAERSLNAKDLGNAEAYLKQATRNDGRGDLARKTQVADISGELAIAYHQQALRTYQKDLRRAIEYWRRSLALEPENAEWQLFLERASRLYEATHPQKSDLRAGKPTNPRDHGSTIEVPF
jgi:tetratricopeptide (TPR) repeat protein